MFSNVPQCFVHLVPNWLRFLYSNIQVYTHTVTIVCEITHINFSKIRVGCNTKENMKITFEIKWEIKFVFIGTSVAYNVITQLSVFTAKDISYSCSTIAYLLIRYSRLVQHIKKKEEEKNIILMDRVFDFVLSTTGFF